MGLLIGLVWDMDGVIENLYSVLINPGDHVNYLNSNLFILWSSSTAQGGVISNVYEEC